MQYFYLQLLMMLEVHLGVRIVNSYPLLFQQDSWNNGNGINFLSFPQNQIRMGNAQSQPLYSTGIPSIISKDLVSGTAGTVGQANIVPLPQGSLLLLPTATMLPAGALPTDSVSNSISNPLPCAAGGLIGNILQSTLCYSLIGALSPCSLLGLNNALLNGGLLGGALLPNLGGVSALPVTAIAPSLVPNLGNLAGLGGCSCTGLIPATSCCNSSPSVDPSSVVVPDTPQVLTGKKEPEPKDPHLEVTSVESPTPPENLIEGKVPREIFNSPKL